MPARGKRRSLFFPVITVAAVLTVYSVLLILEYFGWLLATAGIAALAWFAARHAPLAAVNTRELSRLQAENARLAGELADAQESANAAWDAAASRSPAPVADISERRSRAALLRDPRSGVRPLGKYPQ